MNIRLSQIDANPHRDLQRNPVSEDQILKLVESINRTGFWDNLVVRQHPSQPDRYQLAYGHNRLAACQRLNIEEVDLPVRDLTDYDMLCCMIDENNTQQQITPKIVFENVTAAVELAERLLRQTETVEQFNALLKNSSCTDLYKSKIWPASQYGQAKSAIAADGDGLGRGFVEQFMPSPPHPNTLQNAQRRFIRAHKPALVALLQDAETVYRALVQAGAAGLAWMEGTPADWTGERLLAAGEVLYGDGRMVNRCGRRYLKEHAPPFEWAGDEVAQSEEHAPAPAEPCQHFWKTLRSGVYYLVSRCTRCGKVEEFTWD